MKVTSRSQIQNDSNIKDKIKTNVHFDNTSTVDE